MAECYYFYTQLDAGKSVLSIDMPGCGPVIGSIIQAIQVKRYS